MESKEKEDFVRKELLKFLQTQCPECIDDFYSLVDEIVLSYMVSVLQDLGNEEASEDAFDVYSFTEMMEAYLPGFAQIDRVQMSEWMFTMAAKLTDKDTLVAIESQITTETNPQNFKSKIDCAEENTVCRSRTTSSCTSTISDTPCTSSSPDTPCTSSSSECTRTQSSSETDAFTTNSAEAEGGEDELQANLEDDEQVKLLLEMFPAACTMEVAHCLCVANGSMESAAQLILHRQETGENVTQKSKSQPSKSKRKKSGNVLIGDKEMKKHIIQKYSYVDTEEDKKEHRPTAPKHEPKKLVRYLDGRVVSTKGERFTEIKKDEGDDMKKTYVNLKPAKQYRFH